MLIGITVVIFNNLDASLQEMAYDNEHCFTISHDKASFPFPFLFLFFCQFLLCCTEVCCKFRFVANKTLPKVDFGIPDLPNNSLY